MKNIKKKSLGTHFSMCVQPTFIIGTNNEDGSHNFAPITWISVTCEKDQDYLLVISMYGTKMTKQNVIRTGILSVNLASTDMLELVDYFGLHHAKDQKKDEIPYNVCRGEIVDVPILGASRWVYECEVVQSVETGESTTFFCQIKNVQVDEELACGGTFDIDLTKFDPIVYSGMYHSVGKLLGKIGDFSKQTP
ncbi:MAG: flavin reductase family protein [Lachnospiraceae bacterium]|nr:flavin reductase family protein [Lachnospiraceae bacterium]